MAIFVILVSFQNCSPVQFQELDLSSQNDTGIPFVGGPLVLAVHGACGLSHQDVFSVIPQSNLCSLGEASPILGSGPWRWTCAGANGGADAVCVANKEGLPVAVVGACGGSHQQQRSSAPVDNLCSVGSASVVVASAGPWTWTCAGSNGGPSASCFATRLTPINGACGRSHAQSFSSTPADGLCALGTASSVTGTGPWLWNCVGAAGGSTAACSANKQNATVTTCAPIPGVNAGNWTGVVNAYKKSNLVRQGSTCPVSQFTCDNGVIKLNGSSFALNTSNPDLTAYSSSSTSCKQVPYITCNMNYSYSSGGVFVNWSFSNTNQEFINKAASGYVCQVDGQTVRGSISDILSINKAGPVDAGAPVQCSITVQDVLGHTNTCGGYNSLWCSVKASPVGVSNVSINWDLGGYSSGSYVLTTNNVPQAPVALPAGGVKGGSSDFPAASYNIAATLNSADGLLRCEASTAMACGGSAPLYNGLVSTGMNRSVLPDPSNPGQCMCEGGLVYDRNTNRCQKSCPIGTHFNDRNGVYTCDSCKDATVVGSNGSYTVAGTLLKSSSFGNICVYPGFSEDYYEDPLTQSACYRSYSFGGWPSGAPTSAQFNTNSYPSQDGALCSFSPHSAAKSYLLNCRKTSVREGYCAGATAGGSGSSASGGGIVSQGY